MIYKYRKYQDIDSFVNNIAKTRIDEDYTILFKCNGYDYSKSEFTDRCFGCMFCIFSDPAIKTKFESVWGADFYKKYSDMAFDGKPVTVPNAKLSMKNKTTIKTVTGNSLCLICSNIISLIDDSISRIIFYFPFKNTSTSSVVC